MENPYPAEIIDRLGVLMFQTSYNSQQLRRVLWINADLTIVWSLKNKNTQRIYIFNRENPQNSEPQNGPRRGLDFIALLWKDNGFIDDDDGWLLDALVTGKAERSVHFSDYILFYQEVSTEMPGIQNNS